MDKQKFIEETLKYIKSADDYGLWNKDRTIRETLSLLCNDIGAAQSFLNVIGVKVDLYAM